MNLVQTVRMPQALDNDQQGPTVQHRKLFEEDREFNQGARPGAICSLRLPRLAGVRSRQAAMSPSPMPHFWSRSWKQL